MQTLTGRVEAKVALSVTSAEVEQAGKIDAALLAESPPELVDVVAVALSIIARGGTVTIGSLPSELSTEQLCLPSEFGVSQGHKPSLAVRTVVERTKDETNVRKALHRYRGSRAKHKVF